MWKIFFTYRDKSKCTVKGKGTITPELAVKCFYRYGLHAAESIYQQYPKKDHEPVPLEEKMREFGVDATEMKTAVLAGRNVAGQDAGKGEQMRNGLEIEISDKELLGRLANVKEKKEALERAMAQLESYITSRYEAKKHIAKETYRPALFEDAEEKMP